MGYTFALRINGFLGKLEFDDRLEQYHICIYEYANAHRLIPQIHLCKYLWSSMKDGRWGKMRETHREREGERVKVEVTEVVELGQRW